MNGWDRERKRQDFRLWLLRTIMSMREGQAINLDIIQMADNYSGLDDLKSSLVGTGAGVTLVTELPRGGVSIRVCQRPQIADDMDFQYHVDADRQWMFEKAFLDAPGWVRRDFEQEKHEQEHGFRTHVHRLRENHFRRSERGWERVYN